MLRAIPLPRLLGCLAALTASCAPASESARSVEQGTRRVELSSLGARRTPESRTVARWTVPLELSPWRTDAPHHRLDRFAPGPDAEAVRYLVLPAGGEHSVLVPGPIEGASFTRLVVEVHSAGDRGLSVELLRAGRAALRAGPVRVRGADRLQRVAFDLPAARFEREAFEGLRLVVGRGGPCRIGPIELVDRPLADWLPSPAAPETPVEAGGEWRPALGLTSQAPLVGRLDAPLGGVLVLAARHASELGPRGQRARLEVELADDLGRRTQRSFPLSGSAGEGPAWQEIALELGPHGGYRVELVLRLVTAGSPEAFALVTRPVAYVPHQGPPLVLLVSSDGHRFDHLGAHPSGVGLATPTLDGLAAAGRLFERCWSSTNGPSAAHAALLTGRIAHPAGGPGTRSLATLAERFRDAGWATSAVLSAEDLSPAAGALARGFDSIDAPKEGTRGARASVGRALDLLRAHADRPLFLYLHLADARPPFDPAREHLLRHWPSERGHPFDPARAAPGLPERLLPAWLANLRDLEFPAALYRGEITQLDEELQVLVSEPRVAAGILAYTAGHGMSLGEQGIYWDAQGLYPSVLRVPLVLVGPGVGRGTGEGRAVSSLDLGRTLLDLAGLGRAAFPGRSLLAPPAGAGWQHQALAADGGAAARLEEPWLLIEYLADLEAPSLYTPRRAGQVELYDLSRDPDCQLNQTRAHPDEAARLGAELRAWLGLAGDR